MAVEGPPSNAAFSWGGWAESLSPAYGPTLIRSCFRVGWTPFSPTKWCGCWQERAAPGLVPLSSACPRARHSLQKRWRSPRSTQAALKRAFVGSYDGKAHQRGSAARGLAGPGTLMTLSGPLSPCLCVGAQTNLPPSGEPVGATPDTSGGEEGPWGQWSGPGHGSCGQTQIEAGAGGRESSGWTDLVTGAWSVSHHPTGSPLCYRRTEEGTKAATPGVPFLQSRL